MARTFKDKREVKAKRKKFTKPLWRKRYELSYYGKGPESDLELDSCPECFHPTDFNNGFLSCAQCGWGNYFPANGLSQEDGEEEFEYQSAS